MRHDMDSRICIVWLRSLSTLTTVFRDRLKVEQLPSRIIYLENPSRISMNLKYLSFAQRLVLFP